MSSQSLVDLCSARVGTTIKGKWRLERVIGIGGMAAVYEATHKIGRKEAIKMLHPEIARSADLCARFEQEARATNKLSHPGAVEIRDIDVSEDGCPFLVMELLEGENLGDRATRLGGIEEADMLRYVDELLGVLAAAHAASIVHRDIKLENLFVTTDGELKVLDFGIARMRSGPALTRTGMRLGTTSYMSPEQVRGKEVDGRADVFAVGATMFRLVARRRIHEADTDAEMVAKMAAEPAPPLASVANVSRELAMVVDRALAFDANERYPSATAMQSDVASLRRGEPPEFALARLAPPPPPSLSPHSLQPHSMQAHATAPQSMSSHAITAERTKVEGATQRAQQTTASSAETPQPSITTPYAHVAPPPSQAMLHAAPQQTASPYGQSPASWSPGSTFSSTAPQSMAMISAARPHPSTPPQVARKSNAGLLVALGIAGVLLIGGSAIALVAYAPSKSEDKRAASERDDDDDDGRKSKRKKAADDEETTRKPDESATKTAPSVIAGNVIAAPSALATAPATVAAPPRPPPNRPSGPTSALPGLGVAFPTPSASPKATGPKEKDKDKDKDKDKGRGDIFATPK